MARKGRKYGKKGSLSITSMLDMFTIILVFLLKQMDAEGQLITQAENLKLPGSTSKKTPEEVTLQVIVDKDFILVDNEKIVETQIVHDQDSLQVAAMVPKLEELREIEVKAAQAAGEDEGEGGKVIVQLDKNLEYDVMYKVMATCGMGGYNNISFAVIQTLAEE